MLHSAMHIFEMGGFTIYILFFCSVILLHVVIERGYYFLKTRVDYVRLFSEVKEMVLKGDFDKAVDLCRRKEKGAEIFLSALKERNAGLIELSVKEEKLKRETHLPILATLGTITPFLGLLGTVLGIMKTFFAVAHKGSTNPMVVSSGVSEALICTAAGLFIGITAVTFYNLYKTSVGSCLGRAETMALKLFYLKEGVTIEG